MLFVNDASVTNMIILTRTKRLRTVKMILNRQIVSRKLFVILPLTVNRQKYGVLKLIEHKKAQLANKEELAEARKMRLLAEADEAEAPANLRLETANAETEEKLIAYSELGSSVATLSKASKIESRGLPPVDVMPITYVSKVILCIINVLKLVLLMPVLLKHSRKILFDGIIFVRDLKALSHLTQSDKRKCPTLNPIVSVRLFTWSIVSRLMTSI